MSVEITNYEDHNEDNILIEISVIGMDKTLYPLNIIIPKPDSTLGKQAYYANHSLGLNLSTTGHYE